MDQSSKSQSAKPRSYSDSELVTKRHFQESISTIKYQAQIDHQQNLIELLICSTAFFAGLAVIELLIILK